LSPHPEEKKRAETLISSSTTTLQQSTFSLLCISDWRSFSHFHYCYYQRKAETRSRVEAKACNYVCRESAKVKRDTQNGGEDWVPFLHCCFFLWFVGESLGCRYPSLVMLFRYILHDRFGDFSQRQATSYEVEVGRDGDDVKMEFFVDSYGRMDVCVAFSTAFGRDELICH
jgi:hypothetical protein